MRSAPTGGAIVPTRPLDRIQGVEVNNPPFHTTLCHRVPGDWIYSNTGVSQSHTWGETAVSEGSPVHGGLLRLWEKVPKKSTENLTEASQST